MHWFSSELKEGIIPCAPSVFILLKRFVCFLNRKKCRRPKKWLICLCKFYMFNSLLFKGTVLQFSLPVTVALLSEQLLTPLKNTEAIRLSWMEATESHRESKLGGEVQCVSRACRNAVSYLSSDFATVWYFPYAWKNWGFYLQRTRVLRVQV